MWFVSNAMAKPDNAGAGATDYMHLFGLVALGYMWMRIVKAANEKIAAGAADAERYRQKLIVARFFVEKMLPETSAHLARITAGSEAVMAMPMEGF
jgi:acyl-CoA dehydrogenase